MPSVGMRRSTRVFGTRVLRSGRRLWSAAPFGENIHKKSSPSEQEVWIHLLESSSGGGGGAVENDQPEDVTAMDIDNEIVSHGIDQNPSIGGDTSNVDRYGLVYRRKRKISDPTDKIFGKSYFRKKWRRRKRGDMTFSLITESIDGDSSGWLACFLNLVLRYMSERADFRLSRLSTLMLSEPLSMIFSSHGIHFSLAPSWVTRPGICKISGTRCFKPLFTLEFSAVPSCFMHLHSTIILRSTGFPNYLENSIMEEDSCDIDGFGHQSSSETTSLVKPESVLPDSGFGKEDVSENADSKLARKSLLHLKKAFNPRNKPQKRRSSSRSIRISNLPALSVHDVKKSLAPGYGSPYRTFKSPIQKTAESTIKDLRISLAELTKDIDSTVCGANILVVEADKCYRVNDVVIKVEMSAPRKWSVVVSKDGMLLYNLDAQKIMRPCSTNRVTHDIIWTEENYSWKLEFPNRRDWMIFKEIYRLCFERNFLIATASAIPVPKVQKISYYADYDNGPFVIPESYISVKDDELTRALTKRTAIYDMDSDDEEWLENFNTESSLVNQQHEQLPMEHFELIIDASEENLTSHPDDNDASDLSLDLANKNVVEAVYSYWMRKRKGNHSTLSRIYQSYRPRRDRLRTKTIIRKKRTSARRPRQPGRDKLLWQSIQNELNALEEQKALHKCAEAKAEASRLEGLAVDLRKKAQLLMENADWATYKAAMALRLAAAAAAQTKELMDASAAATAKSLELMDASAATAAQTSELMDASATATAQTSELMHASATAQTSELMDASAAALAQTSELMDASAATTSQTSELMDASAAQTSELMDASEATATKTSELMDASAAATAHTSELMDASATAAAQTSELMDASAAAAAQTLELMDASAAATAQTSELMDASAAQTSELMDASPATATKTSELMDASTAQTSELMDASAATKTSELMDASAATASKTLELMDASAATATSELMNASAATTVQTLELMGASAATAQTSELMDASATAAQTSEFMDASGIDFLE